MKASSSSASRGILRKVAIYGTALILVGYVGLIGAGYSWLRFVRKNDQVALLDVALFRVSAIRHSIARQHFAQAKTEWDAKNYQAAHLLFSAAVMQDPDNIEGRLSGAKFLRTMGATNLALSMLQDGLARHPEERRLIEPTFDLLLTSGRHRHALDLLKQRYGNQFSGSNQLLLQRYEVEATLALDGAPAARQLLEKYPGLAADPASARTVAQIYWESRERLKAIGILKEYLNAQGTTTEYALLASWQEAAGQVSDAVQTARRAVSKFPRETSARVLLVEMLSAETPAGPEVPRAINDYLRDFGGSPESVQELAILAGRKGWVDLNRTLLELGANRLTNLNGLTLSYVDSLARATKFKQARDVLSELELQAPEGASALLTQIRQRQVIVSAALGDSENVREYARRLGALLSRDADGLEACRQMFRKFGIVEAVAELSTRSLVASSSTKK